ncbi:OLC1v1000634C1 [Oldenlandia corymbosa var. corymbosa]|uniref:OLC1v1000634C1 n=1 Tax=Oldenlandia corymbosa var. corymbosa TaxID=529605 RepID=A0AAV1D6V0_OLDCO|nr:OLC1v1000634C1 [Oldenlandia corymbosa var. corymbosa]
MGLLEEISESLDSCEAKKNGFKRSIFAVVSNYKDYEEYVETTQKKFRECYSELESREKNLNSVEESVRQSSEELKLLREHIEERVRCIEDEEKRLVGLAVKEKEWEEGKEKLVEELKEKERELNEKEVLINGVSEKLELDKNELAALEKLVEERLREAGLEEEHIEERRKEIKLIEDGILKKVNELDDRERKVKEREKMISCKGLEDSLRADRERVIEMKEKEEKLIRQDLEWKEKEIDKLLAFHHQRVKELDMREEQFEVKKKELDLRERQFELKEKAYTERKELLERGNKELELKRRELECRVKNLKDFEMIEKNLGAKQIELEDAERSLKECLFQKKQCQSEKELLEDEIKELKAKRKEFEDRITGLKELEVREKLLEVKRKELEEVARANLEECQLKEKQWQSEKESWEKRNKEIELKMKDFGDRIKLFEAREKKFEEERKNLNDELCALEPVKKVVDDGMNSGSSSPNFTLSVELDGLDVHMSLNGFKIDLSSKDEVLKALRKSGAPADMVLSAIELLYPPYLKKVDMKFEGTVASSCIVLLEQLIRISPKIESIEKEHALRLARDWKAMMVTGNSLEVLGFLYLLASFHLASAFDKEELLKLLETAVEHEQIPALCVRLGLRDKIPGLIRNLLKVAKHSLRAIELIYCFGLVKQFPPVPILRQYMRHFKGTGKSDEIDQRIAAAQAVLRCVVQRKLESQYSPRDILNTIKQLSMQKLQGKCSEFVDHYKGQVRREVDSRETPVGSGNNTNMVAEDQHNSEVGTISSSNFPDCLKSWKKDPVLNTGVSPPHAMAFLLANMDGKRLLSFLDMYSVDHQLLQSEVFTALQILDDSSKLVLNVVEGFYSSYPQEQGLRSCIFLLEQLMRISTIISVDVRDVTLKMALDWKAKIMADFGSPLLVGVFLLFVSSFRLISAFDVGELLPLYEIVSKDTSLIGLCQSLGISKMISGTVHPQLEIQKTREDDLQLDIKSATSTVSLEKGVQPLCSNVYMESGMHGFCCTQIPRFIQHSSDPAVLVLDALDFSYFSDSPRNKISELVARSLFHLLRQLMSVSPTIKPCVNRRAFKVANGWKQNLSGSNSWEVLAFLQFVGVYGLSSAFTAEYLLALLEVPPQLLKEACKLIRFLNLEANIPDFITKLVENKQCLLAFEYVYEFNLVDKIPPVVLLRSHVLHTKLAAMKIYKDEKATSQERVC